MFGIPMSKDFFAFSSSLNNRTTTREQVCTGATNMRQKRIKPSKVPWLQLQYSIARSV
jgi:hypothetical protein